MQKIIPNIWVAEAAEEAGEFYANAFPGGRSEVESRYPETGLLDFQREFAGLPLTVAVRIGEYRLRLINADDTFSPNPSVSFMVNFDPAMWDGDERAARAALDDLWGKLSVDGVALMPLQEYPFSAHYGWIQDRFGVSWQLILTDPAGEPRPFIMPSLLFGGSAQGLAAPTVDHYLQVFDDAGLGTRVTYAEQTGPAEPGAVMFSDFRVEGDWITAMDSGVEQEFSFTPGVSLEVRCRDQAEIDRLWTALSAVPEAEQCGWLVDRAGVSWQIVPENIDALLERPGAFARMLEMKKLVIADF